MTRAPAGPTMQEEAGPVPEFGIDMEKAKQFLAERDARRQGRLRRRLADARKDAAAIIERIAGEVKPRRIYQWGSLVHGDHFSEISDIDIALEGLTGPQQYFQALGIAMEETSFRVDIVELEKVHPETADSIRRRGRLVHERVD